MITKVQGEQPFQVLSNSFSISPSSQDYTLQISADGVSYSDLFSVSANTTRLVTNVANGSFYRLRGNTGEVSVNWVRTCSTSQNDGFSPEIYWTSAQTQDAIDEAISDIDLSEYYTKTEVDAKVDDIDASISGITDELSETQQVVSTALNDLNGLKSELSEAEQVTSTALSDLNDRIDDIVIPDVSEFVTSGEVETQITSKNYITSGQAQTQIDEAISDIDLTDYYTKTEVDTKVKAVDDRLTVKDEVISEALNELHNDIENIDIPDVSNMVTSTTISSIVKLTQAEYDALTTKDNNTLYIIG